MAFPFQLAFLIFAVMVPFYMYAFIRFYGTVRTEKPEWVDKRGSLSFFYDGLPQAFDPNVTAEVIRLAYSSRVRQLQSPRSEEHTSELQSLMRISYAVFCLK